MSPFRRYAAGLVLGAVAIVATAVPASAHDQLISSTPAEGEQLADAPSSISMTFSGELLVLDGSTTGAVVLVVDAAGDDWASGPATVTGSDVSVALKPGMPDAGYQVRWQVVSEDGHPISGVIPFTVGDAEPLALASDAGPGASATSGGDASTSDQIADESSSALRVLLIGGIGAAVAVLLLVVFRFLRRARTAAATPETGDPAADL